MHLVKKEGKDAADTVCRRAWVQAAENRWRQKNPCFWWILRLANSMWITSLFSFKNNFQYFINRFRRQLKYFFLCNQAVHVMRRHPTAANHSANNPRDIWWHHKCRKFTDVAALVFSLMTCESHLACFCRRKRQISSYLPATLTLVAVCKSAKSTGESPVSLNKIFFRFPRVMAAHVRGISRVLHLLSPLPAARIPHSHPAVGVSGRTTSARTIMVGTIMHDDTGGMFLYERVHLWSTWLLFFLLFYLV